jgi:hypothetical protein
MSKAFFQFSCVSPTYKEKIILEELEDKAKEIKATTFFRNVDFNDNPTYFTKKELLEYYGTIYYKYKNYYMLVNSAINYVFKK